MFVLKVVRRIPTKINGEWVAKHRTDIIATSPILTNTFKEMAIEEETISEKVWIEEV